MATQEATNPQQYHHPTRPARLDRERRYYFKVSAGLLDPKHRKKIGIALWVFQWFIHHEHEPDGEPDGLVNLGRPVTYHQIAADLGVSAVSVRRDVATLEQEGYIRSARVGGDGGGGGKVYHIAKPFRWKQPHDQWITSDHLVDPAEQTNGSEVIRPSDQKRSHQVITSDHPNKEKRTTSNTTNLNPMSEPSSDEEIKTDPPARRKTQRPPSTDGMVLANELLAEILTNKPDFHMTDDRLASWARSADLMIANDHRSPPRVSALIRWVQHDSFWRTNVLSMDKLREKFDQLEMKMQQTAKGGNFNGKQLSSDEYLKQALAAAARMRGTVQ